MLNHILADVATITYTSITVLAVGEITGDTRMPLAIACGVGVLVVTVSVKATMAWAKLTNRVEALHKSIKALPCVQNPTCAEKPKAPSPDDDSWT